MNWKGDFSRAVGSRFWSNGLVCALAIASFGLLGATRAQLVRADYRPATDTELRAAYCEEVIHNQVLASRTMVERETSEGMDKAPAGGELAKLYDDSIGNEKAFINLYGRYLNYVAAIVSDVDHLQLIAAQNQGDEEVLREDAIRRSANCGSYTDRDKQIACYKSVYSQPEYAELLDKQRVCDNPTWLPY